MRHHHGQMPVMPPAPALIDPQKLAAYVDALPIPPVAKAMGTRPSPGKSSVKLPYYRVSACQAALKAHRDLPATRFWTFGGSLPGPIFETQKGEAVLVDWANDLPAKHFLPIDTRLMGAEAGQPESRLVVHLHGAKAPPVSDGYPENWYVPGKSVVYHYPNEQDATLLWYHDHAMGINRLNTYAGLFGLFVVRDKAEARLELPSGEHEIPLVLFDRMLRTDGQLYYPVSQRPEAPWVPEVFGNAVLVNGKILPYLNVEPRAYRFRLLNASNGRFYFLSLSDQATWMQIGADQGLLSSPVPLAALTLAPAERADLIIDFADRKGEKIVLKNETAELMQFRVRGAAKSIGGPLPKHLREIRKLEETAAVKTRMLTLEEFDNVINEPQTHLLNGARWMDAVTEKPKLGTTEIWSFINVTDDTHPIHLHLVRFQILDRRPFDVTDYLVSKKVRYLAEPSKPEANEAGWKDTVRATPGAVTRIIAKFDGYPGKYVWHCHILEHEDNEMMRPYEVVE